MTYLSSVSVIPNPQFEEIWNSVLEKKCYSFFDKKEELENIFRTTILSIQTVFTIREKTKSTHYVPFENEVELIHLFIDGIKFKCKILLDSFDRYIETLNWDKIDMYLQNFPNSLHNKLAKRLASDSAQKAIASSKGKNWIPILTKLIENNRLDIFKTVWNAFPSPLREEIYQQSPPFFNTAIKTSAETLKEFLCHFKPDKHPKLYPEDTYDESPLHMAFSTGNFSTIRCLLQCDQLTNLQIYGKDLTFSSLFNHTLTLYGKDIHHVFSSFTYCVLFSEEPDSLISKTLSYLIIHRFLKTETYRPIKSYFQTLPYNKINYVWNDFISKWLLLAIQRGLENTVNLVFQNCAKEHLALLYKVDESNQTLLHHAVLSKNKRIIKAVLENVEDISSLFTLNNKNKSIFHLAINSPEILSLLYTYYPPKCHIPSYIHLADAYAQKAMKDPRDKGALTSLHAITEFFLNAENIKEYLKLAFTFPKLSLYLFSYHTSFAVKFLEEQLNSFRFPTRVLIEVIPFFSIKLVRRCINTQKNSLEKALKHIDIKVIAFKLRFEFLTLLSPEAIVDTAKNLYSKKRADLLNRTASIDYGIPFKNQTGSFYNEKVTIIMDEIAKNRLAGLEKDENYEIILQEMQVFFNGLEPIQLAVIASSLPNLTREFLPFFTYPQTIVTLPLLHHDTLSILCTADTNQERVLRYFRAASLKQKLHFLNKQNYIANITLENWQETKQFLSDSLRAIRPLKPSLMRNNMILDITEGKFAIYMTDHFEKLAKQFIQDFSKAAISKSSSPELKTLVNKYTKIASEKFDRFHKQIIHFRETIFTLQLKKVIPEEYLDALLCNVMENPILLPNMGDNKIYIDQTTFNMLPASKDGVKHPFDNIYYPRDEYVLDFALKTKIENWKHLPKPI